MNTNQWDTLWVNGQIATLEAGDVPYGLIQRAAIASQDGKIVWVGAMSDLPGAPHDLAKVVQDVAGQCITPGLIDCHTHLVYAGNRCHEFESRLQGVSYESIARAGGGIQSTVAATRAASVESLYEQSIRRAKALVTEGVTTLEIKSGYGLDLETELKMLQVAKRIGEVLPLTVSLTFLGAHTLPADYKERADEYLDQVCHVMLPAIAKAGLVHAVDVFCEKIGFSLAQTERIFQAAKQHHLGVKCHAEQLSDMGGAALAARYQALSVDHLEFLSEAGVKALAQSETVAVLLPGAFYFLRETQFPPIDMLRQHHVPIAIATDCNPGTSPVTSLLLMLNMACTLFRLTPEEALAGVTRHAAKALGLQNTHGTVAVGKQADLAIWDITHPAELAYRIGFNPLSMLVKSGEIF